MDALAAGVLLAVVRVHAPAAFERLLRWRWSWAALTAAGVCFLANVDKGSALGSTLGYTVAYLTGAAFLLFVYGAAWVPRAGWATRPMATLGRYSYGIYIWHLFAAEVALDLLPGMDHGSSGPAAQAAKYTAAVAAGVLATLVLERPVMRLRDRLVPTASRAAEPPAERSGELVEFGREPASAVRDGGLRPPDTFSSGHGCGREGASADDRGDGVLQRGQRHPLGERARSTPGRRPSCLQLAGRQGPSGHADHAELAAGPVPRRGRRSPRRSTTPGTNTTGAPAVEERPPATDRLLQELARSASRGARTKASVRALSTKSMPASRPAAQHGLDGGDRLVERLHLVLEVAADDAGARSPGGRSHPRPRSRPRSPS